MNSGGEPERDDTGLPPVDIEIPDDARELDRDVQAYYRELRAERRRQRRTRLHGSLARDGIVLPLLACCLILALITGTLLTVFSATSDQNVLPRHSTTAKTSRGHTGRPSLTPGKSPPGKSATTRPATTGSAARTRPASPPASASASASAGLGAATGPSPGVVTTTAMHLPAGSLRLAGDQSVELQSLSGTMLVLIPAECGCRTTVSWLAGIGIGAGAPTFLVATPDSIGEVNQIQGQLSGGLRGDVSVALDAQSVLQASVPVQAGGLTVVLVSAETTVSYVSNLTDSDKALGPAMVSELIA